MSEDLQLLAISVGNTRTALGRFSGRALLASRSLPNSDVAGIERAILEESAELDTEGRTVVVIATVNPRFSSELLARVEPRLEHEVFRIGEELPIPIRSSLTPAAGTGQDRLLAALAAFETVRQACVVIDAGTAITIDFVDGAGVYQGGAIAPGARMALTALHAGAAQLSEVALEKPDDSEPFGKNTREAMLNGVFYGARGAVRMLAERYAERYGGYPMIIATGGDARLLFEGDELVERIVDDLVLHGVAIACDIALSREVAEDASADSGA